LSKNNMLFTHKNIHSLPRFIHCNILYLYRQALIVIQKRSTTSPDLELDKHIFTFQMVFFCLGSSGNQM
ncbi:MAG TPA: hypothetical protein PLV00_07790, partial [Caldisericia bacterium]|nr:hypothetical protein [Caldisericia bacterium]